MRDPSMRCRAGSRLDRACIHAAAATAPLLIFQQERVVGQAQVQSTPGAPANCSMRCTSSCSLSCCRVSVGSSYCSMQLCISCNKRQSWELSNL